MFIRLCCHIILLPWYFKSIPWWKFDDMMLMIMIAMCLWYNKICYCMTLVKTGWWHVWKWNYMSFYDIWVSNIFYLQQRFEPHSCKGKSIYVTMPDRHKIEFFYTKSVCTLNQGIYDMSCHWKIISEDVKLNCWSK